MNDTLRSSKDYWFACVDIDVMRDKELSQSAKFIFAVLCTFAGFDKRGCWPSNSVMAEAAGVSTSTVIRAYKELEARGVIARADRFKEEGSQTSSYTRIVGHNAPCYGEGVATTPPPICTDDTPPIAPMTDRTKPMNDIKDSLTGEANLPNSTDTDSIPEKNHTVTVSTNQESLRSNPEEVCSPDDAPDIMKTTAELFLFKTGRQGLTWDDISALRTLSVTHTPARVQKEIDTACDRFRRQGRLLLTLTFTYIAKSLQFQNSRKKKRQSQTDTSMTGATQADIVNASPKKSLEEIAQIEAIARERGIL